MPREISSRFIQEKTSHNFFSRKRKVRLKMSHRPWNVADEVTLTRLARQGLSPEQIGTQLARTPESIRKRGALLRVSFAKLRTEKSSGKGSEIAWLTQRDVFRPRHRIIQDARRR